MFTKLACLLAVASTAYSVQFQVRNNSTSIPVFVQILGTEYPDPFSLQPTEEREFTFGEPWSGRIWGRVDCYDPFDCDVAGPIPTSLAEVTVGAGYAFYDLSLADGFNIDLAVGPIGGTPSDDPYRCSTAICSYPILDDCPEELKVFNADNRVVSCQEACNVFDDDVYCCRGEHDTPDTCKSSDWPVDYPAFFKQRCPDAYSYAYDDEHSTRTCDANGYFVTFL